MAYNSGTQLAGLAGIVGAGVGAYLGYNLGLSSETVSPIHGALIMGGIGLVAGSLGAFILKSAVQFIIYVVMILIVSYFFREQIEAMTGIDPVAAVESALNSIGLSLPGSIATGE